MRRRGLVSRRNAHQPDDGQLEFVAAPFDEARRFLWHDTSLLWLLTRVDLYEQGWSAPAFFDFVVQQLGDLWPVDGMDGIEQHDRFADLVRLQWPHEMQHHIGPFGFQEGPLCFRFLHAVLAENAVTESEHGTYLFGRESL